MSDFFPERRVSRHNDDPVDDLLRGRGRSTMLARIRGFRPDSVRHNNLTTSLASDGTISERRKIGRGTSKLRIHERFSPADYARLCATPLQLNRARDTRDVPTIRLFQGTGLPPASWDPLPALLLNERADDGFSAYRVIMSEYPRWWLGTTWDMAAYELLVDRALELKKTIVIGHSLGAMRALHRALQDPASVEGLGLISVTQNVWSPPVANPTWAMKMRRICRQLRNALRLGISFFIPLESPLGHYIAHMDDLLLGEETLKKYPDILRKWRQGWQKKNAKTYVLAPYNQLQQMICHLFAAATHTFLDDELALLASQISEHRFPVQIVVGMTDRVLPAEDGIEIFNRIRAYLLLKHPPEEVDLMIGIWKAVGEGHALPVVPELHIVDHEDRDVFASIDGEAFNKELIRNLRSRRKQLIENQPKLQDGLAEVDSQLRLPLTRPTNINAIKEMDTEKK